MGGKSGAKVEVTEYRLSIHMGIALKVDKLHALYIDEKKFWSGTVTDNTVLGINQPELMGGPKQEGGVGGEVHVLMGAGGQVLSPWLASKLTGQPGVPGFRGITSLFFTGFQGGRNGFYWTANQPYIKTLWVTVSSKPQGLTSTIAEFPDGTVNPAHVIYEAMTLPELGMGAPASAFDLASWNAAAQTLWDEGFGVALAWINQSSVEQIAKDLQEHINGWVFQHPRTGKWTLKLVRGDYDANTLRTITPDDGIFSNFQRKGLGETVNEIVATWTNPENEQEETVTVHDNGNLAAQGALVSDSRNYYAVRKATLAVALAQRDLRVASAPLCACDVVLNRKFWDLVPGDVVKITWPDYGLNGLVMRVGKVDYGMPGNQALKVNLIEDIFAIPAGSYVTPPSTGWIDPSQPPAPIPAALQQVVTLPAYFLANLMDASSLADPEVRAGVLVTQSGQDTFEYRLMSYLANAAGAQGWTAIDQLATLGYAPLQLALVREPTSTILNLNPIYGSTYPRVGSFIWIGQQANFGETVNTGSMGRAELCLITGFGAQGWTVLRGVLDTQPLDWPQGTPFWIIDPAVTFDDVGTIRSAGELARYKALPQTSQGMLPEASAAQFTGTLVARPYFPSRPANVKINNVLWGPTARQPAGTNMTFTWSNRNRTTETSQVLAWDAATVAPEANHETVVELFDGDPATGSTYKLRRTVAGSAATLAFTYAELLPVSLLGNIGWTAYSQRDGKTSFSRVSGKFQVAVAPTVYFVRAGSHVILNNVTSATTALPSLADVVPENAGLFMIVMHRFAVTAPAGWSLVVTAQCATGSGTDQHTSVYRKDVVTAADSGASTVWQQATSGRMIVQAALFSTSEAGYRVAVEQALGVTGTSAATVAPPVVTSDGEGQCVLQAASFTNSVATASSMTPPTGFTLISPASVADQRLGVAYRNLTPSQSTSGVFTIGSSGSYGGAVSIRMKPVSLNGGYGNNYGAFYG